MESLFSAEDLEFIKYGDDVPVLTPREIFAPQNRRGPSVKRDLYRYLYAFFLLHPEQKEDEFGNVLYFFVGAHHPTMFSIGISIFYEIKLIQNHYVY